MYILELIPKLVSKFKQKNTKAGEQQENLNDEKCEHIFLPIDSTGNILACTKCGYVIKKLESHKIFQTHFIEY